MNAAVVELDTLTDAVRAGAEDYDLPAVARSDLGFLLVGAVLGGIVLRRLKSMPRMFEASLAELIKDHQEIDTNR